MRKSCSKTHYTTAAQKKKKTTNKQTSKNAEIIEENWT